MGSKGLWLSNSDILNAPDRPSAAGVRPTYDEAEGVLAGAIRNCSARNSRQLMT